jgi:hypothetical protein
MPFAGSPSGMQLITTASGLLRINRSSIGRPESGFTPSEFRSGSADEPGSEPGPKSKNGGRMPKMGSPPSLATTISLIINATRAISTVISTSRIILSLFLPFCLPLFSGYLLFIVICHFRLFSKLEVLY